MAVSSNIMHMRARVVAWGVMAGTSPCLSALFHEMNNTVG